MDLKMVTYYERIMSTSTRLGLSVINDEIGDEVIFNMIELRDAMLLQMAIQVRLNSIMLLEIIEGPPETKLLDPPEVDQEQEQLDKFAELEHEDFLENNVVQLKDYKKKD